MDSPFWFSVIKWEWPIVYINGVTDYNFQIKLHFSEIVFVLANSVDPDEMLHYAAFHLGLHCLPKYALRSH